MMLDGMDLNMDVGLSDDAALKNFIAQRSAVLDGVQYITTDVGQPDDATASEPGGGGRPRRSSAIAAVERAGSIWV